MTRLDRGQPWPIPPGTDLMIAAGAWHPEPLIALVALDAGGRPLGADLVACAAHPVTADGAVSLMASDRDALLARVDLGRVTSRAETILVLSAARVTPSAFDTAYVRLLDGTTEIADCFSPVPVGHLLALGRRPDGWHAEALGTSHIKDAARKVVHSVAEHGTPRPTGAALPGPDLPLPLALGADPLEALLVAWARDCDEEPPMADLAAAAGQLDPTERVVDVIPCRWRRPVKRHVVRRPPRRSGVVVLTDARLHAACADEAVSIVPDGRFRTLENRSRNDLTGLRIGAGEDRWFGVELSGRLLLSSDHDVRPAVYRLMYEVMVLWDQRQRGTLPPGW